MTEEIFDVVNERDEVVGQAPRREVHARSLKHRAVHILVFNARGQVFLQKRSLKKDLHPGVWDSSTSGHLDTGEDYDAALKVFGEIATEEPGDLLSALRMSQIYRQKRDFAKAREFADKASALDAANIEVRYNEVSIYEAEGKLPEAIKTLKGILAGLPKRTDSLGERNNRAILMERLAFLYRSSDQVEQAVATFREIA